MKKSEKKYDEELQGEKKLSPKLKKGNPKSNVKSLYDAVLKSTLVEFKDKGSIPPRVVFSVASKGKSSLMVAPLDECKDFNDRATLMNAMAHVAVNENIGVEATISVCEAWFSSVEKEEYENDTYVMPSKDPKKKEALMIAAEDEVGNCITSMYEIVRGDEIKLVSLNKDFPMSGKWYGSSGTEDEHIQNNILSSFWDRYRELKTK